MVVVYLTPGAIAQKAPPARPFERFDGCVLEPDEWTDGDSFRVRLPDGRLETFRLYFVDTTESRSRGKRSDEQAAYFGLTRAQAIELIARSHRGTAAMLHALCFNSCSAEAYCGMALRLAVHHDFSFLSATKKNNAAQITPSINHGIRTSRMIEG